MAFKFAYFYIIIFKLILKIGIHKNKMSSKNLSAKYYELHNMKFRLETEEYEYYSLNSF